MYLEMSLKSISLAVLLSVMTMVMTGCLAQVARTTAEVPTVAPEPAPSQTPTLSPSSQLPRSPAPPTVLGKQGVDLSGYSKVELNYDQVEVSSIMENYGKGNLLSDAGGATFWHVRLPKETDEAWVLVDMRSEGTLAGLGTRLRTD